MLMFTFVTLQTANTKTIAITKTAAAASGSISKVPASRSQPRRARGPQAVDTADKLRLGKTTDTQSERTVRDAVKAFLDNKEHHGCLS